MYALGKSPLGEAEATAKKWLDRVGLAEKHDAETGGNFRAVNNSVLRSPCALAMEPDVMLFDEPTSSLDPELVGDVLKVIRDVATSSNMTMLLVTHEMRFARQVADRVAFCDSGRVVELAPPEELFTNPKESRTRVFLDAVLNPV